ncbi:MAG: DsbA family protein [Paracoccaceae bacterium]
MARKSLAAAATALSLCLAGPALAQSMTMTDAERAAFRAEVRAFLMENPEVIFEAAAEYERRSAQAQADMDNALVEINAETIFNDGHSWVGGNPDGDLILVEFMDYRCSYCRRAQPEVSGFLGNDGNVRLVIKEFPILGPQSDVMSRFAIAVQQNGTPEAYEAVHDRLMAWNGEIGEADMRALAAEVGVDADTVITAMRGEAVNAVIAANRDLAQRLQISGTPTFVLGDGSQGELLRGLLPAPEMATIAARLRG